MVWSDMHERVTPVSAEDDVSPSPLLAKRLDDEYDHIGPEFPGVETLKIIASLISLLGCFFVIVTYLLFPPLRLHHSSLILWMALMSMLFHALVIIEMETTISESCGTAWLVHLSMVAQEFYFFVLAFNFYYSTKFPFHLSRWLIPVYHIFVWLVSGGTAAYAAYSGTGKISSFGFCWFSSYQDTDEKLITYVFAIPVATGHLISIAWYVIATKRVRRGSQHSDAQTNLDTMRRYLLWSFVYWWIIAIPYYLRHRNLVIPKSPEGQALRFIGRMALAFKGTLSAAVWAKSTSMRNAYRLWKQGNWDDYMKVYEATWVLRRQIIDFATKGIQRGAALADESDSPIVRSYHHHPHTTRLADRQLPLRFWSFRWRVLDPSSTIPRVRSFEVDGSSTDQKAVFRDFEPDAFREIRKMSGISSEQYVQSFAGRTRERFSSGKSGSLFYYTGDQLFILKTCTPAEQRYLLSILPQYMEHLKKHPKSYLCRYVGCHELVMEHHSVLFIVLTNILNNSNAAVDEFYDLKGSWVGRFQELARNGVQRVCKYCGRDFIVGMSKEVCGQNPVYGLGHEVLVTGKDLNWSCRKLGLPTDLADQLGGQLYADCEFLERMNSMDYSLIIGLSRCPAPSVDTSAFLVRTMRCRDTNGRVIGTGASTSPSHGDEACLISFEAPYSLATTPRPLTRSSSIGTEGFPGNATVVYMGIIDILTPWSIRKSCEHWLRVHVQCQDGNGISCVNPAKYAERFCRNVIDTVIFGGNGTPRSTQMAEDAASKKEKECVMVDFRTPNLPAHYA